MIRLFNLITMGDHMNRITIDYVKSMQKNLLKMADMSESTVISIFGGDPSVPVDNIYTYDMPIYKKMVFRFRQGNNSPFQLCKGCDVLKALAFKTMQLRAIARSCYIW